MTAGTNRAPGATTAAEPVAGLLPSDARSVACEIRGIVEQPAFRRHIDLFLCGASAERKDSIRAKLQAYFAADHEPWRFNIHTPEVIFQDLMEGEHQTNLLKLENLLARSVDAILLVPESPGSFAELGAFANHKELRDKLILLVDSGRRKEKSFIMRGPVRLIAEIDKRRVIFEPVTTLGDHDLGQSVVRRLGSVLRSFEMRRINVTSLLEAHYFVEASLYLLERLTRRELAFLLGAATGLDDGESLACVSRGLEDLMRAEGATVGSGDYSLTPAAVATFSPPQSNATLRRQLDDLRTEILTVRYRRKKMRLR